MKKLLLVLVVFIFMQCQIKIEPKSAAAQNTFNITELVGSCNGRSYLDVTVYNRDGIEYRVFSSTGNNGAGIFVVNHTKELLEVRLLERELKNFIR